MSKIYKLMGILLVTFIVMGTMGLRCGPRDLDNRNKVQSLLNRIDAQAATNPGPSTVSTNFTTFTETSFTSQDGTWTEIAANGNVEDIYLYLTSSYTESTCWVNSSWTSTHTVSSSWITTLISSWTSCSTWSTSAITDAWDGYGFLNIIDGGQGQPFRGVSSGVALEDSNNELVLPPQTLMGLQVARKVYANPNGSEATKDNFIRWLEILTNNTASPITVDLVIGGNGAHNTIMDTADGDSIMEPGVDNYYLSRDENSNNNWIPYLGNLLDGTMGVDDGVDRVIQGQSGGSILDYDQTTGWTINPYATSTHTQAANFDDVIHSWTGVTVNPGETKILMHMEIMAYNKPAGGTVSNVRSMAEGLETAPAKAVAGMDSDEKNAVINWPAARNNCNVTAPAHSAPAGTLIGITNLNTLVTAQSYALRDGSFGVCIDAGAGDELEVSANGKVVGTITAQ